MKSAISTRNEMSEDAVKTISHRMLVANVVVLLMCMAVGRAQTVTGPVTDQTGAVIPGANVVAIHTDTGASSSATSDSARDPGGSVQEITRVLGAARILLG
jgi:hypothetical protein